MKLFRDHFSIIAFLLLSGIIGAFAIAAGETLNLALHAAELDASGWVTSLLLGWGEPGAFHWGPMRVVYVACVDVIWPMGLPPASAIRLTSSGAAMIFAISVLSVLKSRDEERSWLVALASLLTALGCGADTIDLLGCSLAFFTMKAYWSNQKIMSILLACSAASFGVVGCIAVAAFFVSEWLLDKKRETPTETFIQGSALFFSVLFLVVASVISMDEKIPFMTNGLATIGGVLLVMNAAGVVLLLSGSLIPWLPKRWRGFVLIQLPLYLIICPPLLEMAYDGGVLFAPLWFSVGLSLLALIALGWIVFRHSNSHHHQSALVCLLVLAFSGLFFMLSGVPPTGAYVITMAPFLFYLSLVSFRQVRFALKGVGFADGGTIALWVLIFAVFWTAPVRTLTRGHLEGSFSTAKQSGAYALLLEDISGDVVIDNDPGLKMSLRLLAKLDATKELSDDTIFGQSSNFFDGFTLPPEPLSDGTLLKEKHIGGQTIWMLHSSQRIPPKLLSSQLPLVGDFGSWLDGPMRPWIDYRQLRFNEGKAPLEKLFYRHAQPLWRWSDSLVLLPQNVLEIPYRWLTGVAVFESRQVNASVWRLCEGCP